LKIPEKYSKALSTSIIPIGKLFERKSSGNYFSIKSEVEVKKTNTPFFLPIIEKYNIRFFPRFYSLKLL